MAQKWYTVGMDESQNRLQTELNALVAVIVRLAGLPSNWNGEVSLVPGANFKGKKRFSCGIELDADLANQEARWSTLIHEALHSISVGYTASAYWELPGWEEGLIEQLQRLYRSAALEALKVSVDADIFLVMDAEHRYNRYIAALETLRVFLDAEPLDFYLALLRMPIRERPGSMLYLSQSLDSAERIEFLRLFSASHTVLKEALELW